MWMGVGSGCVEVRGVDLKREGCGGDGGGERCGKEGRCGGEEWGDDVCEEEGCGGVWRGCVWK